MIIESKDNKIIKYAKQIQDKKYAELFGECFLETEKIVFDCLEKLEIKTILVANSFFDKFKERLAGFEDKVFKISDTLAKGLSKTESGANIFAIAKIKKTPFDLSKNTVVLENLQDPSNLGAIIRSALAFDFKNIIAINCCFAYSSKVIRSSMSYVFDINYQEMKFEDFKKFKNNNNICLYVADMGGENINQIKNIKSPMAFVVGNEGKGVSREMKAVADKVVAIPMKNNVESLNASVSASIIMNLLNKGE